MNPLFAAPGAPELVLIFLVVILLFGAKKLPELARGSGRALRIFKSETKGLVDGDDDDDDKPALPASPIVEPRPQFLDPEADPIVREQRDGA